MALQSSGAISMSNIQGEFGGSNPISLSEYYGAERSLPTSGKISLSQFYGLRDALPPSFTRVGYYGNQSINLRNPPDPYRWVVIVMHDMQGPRLPTLNTPSCNGSTMSTISNQNSGYSNDGHRIGIFYKHVPSGSSVTISGSTLGFSLYEITGISNMGSKLNVYTGNTAYSSASYSWCIGAWVTNFSDRGGISVPSGMSTGHGGGPAVSGYTSNMNATSKNYVVNSRGNTVVLRALVTCEYGI